MVKCFSRTKAARVGWYGLVLVGLLLILTACGDSTPLSQAATVPPLQSLTPSSSIAVQAKPTTTLASPPTTSMSDSRTHEAVYAATQSILPTPTVIPTLIPGAKPCQARDFSLEKGSVSSPSGHNMKEWFLANNGATVCTLKGYPVLREVEPSGQVATDFSFSRFNSFGSPKALDEAATPLISIAPGHAAQVLTDYWRCDEGYDQSVPMRNLEMLWPNNTGKIVMETRQSCPGNNRFQVSNFQYAPGDWRTKP